MSATLAGVRRRTFAERQAAQAQVQAHLNRERVEPVWLTHRSRPIPEAEARALRRRFRGR